MNVRSTHIRSKAQILRSKKDITDNDYKSICKVWCSEESRDLHLACMAHWGDDWDPTVNDIPDFTEEELLWWVRSQSGEISIAGKLLPLIGVVNQEGTECSDSDGGKKRRKKTQTIHNGRCRDGKYGGMNGLNWDIDLEEHIRKDEERNGR